MDVEIIHGGHGSSMTRQRFVELIDSYLVAKHPSEPTCRTTHVSSLRSQLRPRQHDRQRDGHFDSRRPPGTDTFLLDAIVNTVFCESLVRLGRLEPVTNGLATLEMADAPFAPEAIAGICKIGSVRLKHRRPARRSIRGHHRQLSLPSIGRTRNHAHAATGVFTRRVHDPRTRTDPRTHHPGCKPRFVGPGRPKHECRVRVTRCHGEP
jgi:hypothetical protein